MKILLVDDEMDFRDCLAELIELETGFSVSTAENGQVAFEMCQENTYDILVIDYRMPKMNGADFFKNLAETNNPNSKARVLFLSGFIEEINLQIDGEYKISFKSKPIAPQELINFIADKKVKEAS